MNWIEVVVSVISGLLVTIPLVSKLIEFVQKGVKEKNWNNMLQMLMEYMEAAEQMFVTGAEKKEWVIAMITAAAETINYDIDLDIISKMIDDLCVLSKTVNPPNEKASEEC